MRDRALWIDFGKAVAIIAVIIQHTAGILYQNATLRQSTYFAVGVFILLAGVTSYLSLEKHGIDHHYLLKRIWKILKAYLIATTVYTVYLYRYFDFEVWLKHVIHFNISGPLYYVMLYLQLTLAAPILYKIVCYCKIKKKIIFYILTMGIILGISVFTTYRSNILSVSLGGGKLLGGTYLLLFTVGMFGGAHWKEVDINRSRCLIKWILFLSLSCGWLIWMRQNGYVLDSYFPLGDASAVPGFTLIMYSMLVMGVIRYTPSLFQGG